MPRLLMAFLVCISPALAFGQVPFPQLPQPITTFSFEDKDWGVETTMTPKRAPYHAPTPTSIPGARVIKTLELKGLLESNKTIVVVDVLDSKTRRTIPGAFWMSGGGDGQFFAAEKSRFSTALEKLTSSDKTRPIVFLCLSSECWLSYNASLHALEAGYKDVIWYRGGTASWTGASLDRKKPENVSW
jgi:PQQ-dependent catabolism-associated CXXCW motif protein